MTVIPDSIEPVVGWRSWSVDDYGFLRSQHNNLLWTPGERVEAICSPQPLTIPRVSYRVWRPRHREGVSTSEAQKHTDQERARHSGIFGAPYIRNRPTVELPAGMGWVLEQEHQDGDGRHQPPEANCMCGIYAVSELSGAHSGAIIGRVALWGKVVPGTKGWRGQFAYPVELFINVAKKRLGKQEVVIPEALLSYDVPIRSTREINLASVAA